jgi:hypothetical protein
MKKPERLTHRVTRTAAIAVLLSLTAPFAAGADAAPRTDPPGDEDGNHCVSAIGVDVNELLEVSEQIVNPFCVEASAGERWRMAVPWIVNVETGGEIPTVYPDGYVPLRPVPMDDFLAKVDSIEMVVDGGTRRAKTYIFSGSEALRTGFTLDQLDPGWPALPMTIILTPALRALSEGEHSRELTIVMSATHCDGLDTDAELSCLPAGRTSTGAHPITFTTPDQAEAR